MRLAVVSDIHGNLPALEAVIAEIAAERVDSVFNLGDIVSGPLWPRETAERLMALGWPTIRGNHERQALQVRPDDAGGDDEDAYAAAEITAAQRDWLAALPADALWAEGRVQALHASPGDDLMALMETVTPGFGVEGHPGIRTASPDEIRSRLGTAVQPAAELLLCGHTHIPRAVWLDGRLIVNPGSVGRPAYGHDLPHPHIAETGAPHARWALLQRSARGWSVQLRATAYDWEASARRAASLGFADWAQQLRTGRA